MINNVINNDMALKSLNLQIQIDDEVGFDSIKIRYLEYVMNLVVKDLLYESKKKEKRRNEDVDEKEESMSNEKENIDNDESEIKKRREMERK